MTEPELSEVDLEIHQAFDAVQLILDLARHALIDFLRRSAGIGSGDRKLRRRDLRILRDRQEGERDGAGDRNEHREDPGQDRPVNEELCHDVLLRRLRLAVASAGAGIRLPFLGRDGRAGLQLLAAIGDDGCRLPCRPDSTIHSQPRTRAERDRAEAPPCSRRRRHRPCAAPVASRVTARCGMAQRILAHRLFDAHADIEAGQEVAVRIVEFGAQCHLSGRWSRQWRVEKSSLPGLSWTEPSSKTSCDVGLLAVRCGELAVGHGPRGSGACLRPAG